MRALLVLMIGLAFGLMTPQLSEAHDGKQNDRADSYSHRQDDSRSHGFGYQRYDRHNRQHKAWKEHRKQHHRAQKEWRRHNHRHEPVRVIYRDRWSVPLFPGIVIHLPL
ncbi:MAG: hypothetical protein RQ754_07200 [Desulfuromonadales bacterium]|nr:hypothetical protein [Desulfuromonadales bacterium]